MVLSAVFHPSKAYEKIFNYPNNGLSALVALLTAIVFAASVYILVSEPVLSAFSFFMNLIQWLVFTVVLWFFGLAHTGRKKHAKEITFSQCAALTSKLWTINLLGAVIMLIFVGIIPYLAYAYLLPVLVILVVIAVMLLVAWIVSSIIMLKVVFETESLKLLVNWVILLILNAFIVGFISNLIIRTILTA